MRSAKVIENEHPDTEREEVIEKLEVSNEPGARVLARIIRQADAEDAEAVMWSQNWNAHSRSS